MWADNVDLLLGGWRVGVRPDTDATRQRLARLFAAHLDDGGEPTRTNFSIRGGGSRWWRRAGTELYVAGDRVVAGGRFDHAVHHLVGHLAGVAATSDLERGHTVVVGRLITRGDRAVLVTATCTGPIDASEPASADASEPASADASGSVAVPADLVERPVWHPAVDPVGRAVVVPPALDRLDWAAAKITPPPSRGPDRLQLVGVVTPPDAEGEANLPAVWSASRGRLDEWGVLLALFDDDGRAVAATSKPEILAAATRLLT